LVVDNGGVQHVSIQIDTLHSKERIGV
jgi:hypothetical protein